MTRRVRRSRTKQDWGPGYEMLLCFGHDFFNELDHKPTRPELRSAWKELRDKLTFELANTHPGRRAWGWWEFESAEPRDDRDEADQLRAMGLLTEDEERVLAIQASQRRFPRYVDD